MKKILLIGDSIRMSYQPLVADKLDGLAEVVGPEDNCRYAKYTLGGINGWIDHLGKPDIVHWNNGIWDVSYLKPDEDVFTPLEEYLHQMARILRELRKTNAEIIWATTTPVNPNCASCRNREIDHYNDAMQALMFKENIPVNDLNTIVKSDIHLYIQEDNLHLSDRGQIVCADAVVKAIMKFL